jgi:hypothetical protein
MVQLEAVTRDKCELEQRLEAAKSATKKILDASNAKYIGLSMRC